MICMKSAAMRIGDATTQAAFFGQCLASVEWETDTDVGSVVKTE